MQLVETSKPNRVLVGACLPYVFKRKLNELGQQVDLDPALIEVVDLQPAISAQSSMLKAQSNLSAFSFQLSALEMGIAKLKWAEPEPVAIAIDQKALVIGGGIAGMTAALAIADHGFKVDLVEKASSWGVILTGCSAPWKGTQYRHCWRTPVFWLKGIPRLTFTPRRR